MALVMALVTGLTPHDARAADETEPSPDPPIEIGGPAAVLDGDTLSIGAQVIRIEGIDAPEDGQDCARADGERWRCGAAAERALRELVATGVRCAGREFDPYRRLIASCRADGRDLGTVLVASGLALAYRRYSDRYVREERVAREAGRGVWAGPFERPWDWRRSRWREAGNESPSPDCPIKGNVSRDGTRIYHAPWSRSYARTRIDESNGERWFCSEAEALEAGWRAPVRRARDRVRRRRTIDIVTDPSRRLRRSVALTSPDRHRVDDARRRQRTGAEALRVRTARVRRRVDTSTKVREDRSNGRRRGTAIDVRRTPSLARHAAAPH